LASQVDVYNLALTYLDISQTVQSVNDNTPAAGTCNRFYDHARQYVLEHAHWDFATKTVALSLLVDQSLLPSTASQYFPGWRFIYQRPNDCMRSLAVTTQYGLRVNPYTRTWWYSPNNAPQWGQYRPPWQEMLDTISTPNGQSIDILTDQDAAWLVYTTDVTNVGIWSRHFMECVAWQIAVRAAGPLSANQTAKQNAIKQAEASIASALAMTLNQKREDPYPDSPVISARW